MEIIEKHDNDKEYVFTCPICGTVFTARYRFIHKNTYIQNNMGNAVTSNCNYIDKYTVKCPNCDRIEDYDYLKEYQHK